MSAKIEGIRQAKSGTLELEQMQAVVMVPCPQCGGTGRASILQREAGSVCSLCKGGKLVQGFIPLMQFAGLIRGAIKGLEAEAAQRAAKETSDHGA